jgi:hypothetical protein
MDLTSNPFAVYIGENILHSIQFFKHHDFGNVSLINLPDVFSLDSVVTADKINLVSTELLAHNKEEEDDLILAFYDGNDYHFLKFINLIHKRLKSEASYIMAGLLNGSASNLLHLGVVDIKFLDSNQVIDSVMQLEFNNPILSVDSLDIEYTEFNLLFQDIKYIFGSTKLPDLFEQNYQVLSEKFVNYVNSFGAFSLNLELYFIHAFKNKKCALVINQNNTMHELIFKGRKND